MNTPITPLGLSDEQAAAALGRSVGWLRNRRSKDRKLLASGEEIEGPAWVVIGRQPFYEPATLQEWWDSRKKICSDIPKPGAASHEDA